MNYNLFLIVLGMSGVSYILLSLLWYTWRLGIGPTPSTHQARQAITKTVFDLCIQLQSVSKQIQQQDRSTSVKPLGSHHAIKIYELGSGWGGLSIHLAKQLNRCSLNTNSFFTSLVHIKGYELALIPYAYSKAFMCFHQLRSGTIQAQATQKVQVSFYKRDFITVLEDLEPNSVMIAYLCPKQMERIAMSLEQTERTGTAYLLSLTFALPRHQAISVERLPTVFKDRLYLYCI